MCSSSCVAVSTEPLSLHPQTFGSPLAILVQTPNFQLSRMIQALVVTQKSKPVHKCISTRKPNYIAKAHRHRHRHAPKLHTMAIRTHRRCAAEVVMRARDSTAQHNSHICTVMVVTWILDIPNWDLTRHRAYRRRPHLFRLLQQCKAGMLTPHLEYLPAG